MIAVANQVIPAAEASPLERTEPKRPNYPKQIENPVEKWLIPNTARHDARFKTSIDFVLKQNSENISLNSDEYWFQKPLSFTLRLESNINRYAVTRENLFFNQTSREMTSPSRALLWSPSAIVVHHNFSDNFVVTNLPNTKLGSYSFKNAIFSQTPTYSFTTPMIIASPKLVALLRIRDAVGFSGCILRESGALKAWDETWHLVGSMTSTLMGHIIRIPERTCRELYSEHISDQPYDGSTPLTNAGNTWVLGKINRKLENDVAGTMIWLEQGIKYWNITEDELITYRVGLETASLLAGVRPFTARKASPSNISTLNANRPSVMYGVVDTTESSLALRFNYLNPDLMARAQTVIQEFELPPTRTNLFLDKSRTLLHSLGNLSQNQEKMFPILRKGYKFDLDRWELLNQKTKVW